MYSFHRIKELDELRDLYELARDHGVLKLAFHGNDLSLVEFIDAMRGAHVYMAACPGDGTVGFAWLNMWTGLAAAVHVCMFPTVPREIRVPLGKSFLRYLFDLKDHEGNPYRTSLFGPVPWSYKHAREYAKAIGMHETGVIFDGIKVNGKIEDLVLHGVTANDLKDMEVQ